MFHRFLEKLSADLGQDKPLVVDAKGECLLQLDQKLEISLRENPTTGITLFAVLAPLPEKELENFLLQVMSANLFGKETGGSVLGCDKECKMLTLQRILPNEITYRQFYEAVEDFANYSEVWKEDTEQYRKI